MLCSVCFKPAEGKTKWFGLCRDCFDKLTDENYKVFSRGDFYGALERLKLGQSVLVRPEALSDFRSYLVDSGFREFEISRFGSFDVVFPRSL